MRIYKIVVGGDNDHLHRQVLEDVVALIETTKRTWGVHRAWIEPIDKEQLARELPSRVVVR